jgi:hypothetical protein
MKITRLSLPKKGKISSYFGLFDIHGKEHSRAVIKHIIKYSSHLPKTKRKLILGGDFLDAKYFYKKDEDRNKWIDRKDGVESFFLPEFLDECEWGNAMLDLLQEHFGEIIYLDGNHEDRIREFSQSNSCPAKYKEIFSVQNALRLREREIKYIKYNDWLDIGNLCVKHGMYHGTSALDNSYKACTKSVLFGHIHQVSSKSFFVRGDTRMAWSAPCASTLNPEYLKNKENNWSEGFVRINVAHDGNFWLYTFNVWDGKLVLPDGTILE